MRDFNKRGHYSAWRIPRYDTETDDIREAKCLENGQLPFTLVDGVETHVR